MRSCCNINAVWLWVVRIFLARQRWMIISTSCDIVIPKSRNLNAPWTSSFSSFSLLNFLRVLHQSTCAHIQSTVFIPPSTVLPLTGNNGLALSFSYDLSSMRAAREHGNLRESDILTWICRSTSSSMLELLRMFSSRECNSRKRGRSDGDQFQLENKHIIYRKVNQNLRRFRNRTWWHTRTRKNFMNPPHRDYYSSSKEANYCKHYCELNQCHRCFS